MTDYKATLNLPETAFPMKAGLPQREPEMLARWDSIGLYRKLRQIGEVGSARRRWEREPSHKQPSAVHARAGHARPLRVI